MQIATKLDLSNFVTTKVKSMENIFNGCSDLVELNIPKFKAKKNTEIKGIFNSCSSLKNLTCNDVFIINEFKKINSNN